jgi:hypothetical protein
MRNGLQDRAIQLVPQLQSVCQVDGGRARALRVSPDVLRQYAGTYEARLPQNPTTPMTFTITMRDDRLYVGDRPLIPLSETTFGGAVRVSVVTNQNGDVVKLLVTAEGDLEAHRAPSSTPNR